MTKQIREITTNVTETGKIELVSYEWTPDKASFPRHADVLRYMAYDQAKDLADALDKTLLETVEQLCDETDDLTYDEERRLRKIYATMHRAHTALKDTFGALWEWHQVVERTREFREQTEKALKELDESDKTDNINQ